MFKMPEQVYIANGFGYPILHDGPFSTVKHLADPWLMFAQHRAVAMCDQRELNYIDVGSREPNGVCNACIEMTNQQRIARL